jgi:stage II sporulation protein D
MVLRLAIALCLLALPAGAVETMRISMGPRARTATISAQSLAYGPDSEEGPFTLLPRGTVTVSVSHGKLSLDGAKVVGEAIRFRVGEQARSVLPGTLPIRAGKKEVRGDVVVRLVRGRLQLINVLPLEAYLAAVLGGEMPASFPEEALKAQAVAARTYAMEKKLGALGEPYYLGSSVLSQVYAGISREDARTQAAVRDTRGQILTFHLQPIEAYFHASCGGRTESGRDALGRDLPYLKPVDCPCGKLPQSRWSLELSPDTLEKALGRDADSLQVLSRTPTGRARRIQVGDHRMDATTFRAKLGYSEVKSLSFTVEKEGAGYLLHGRGYGHGAGMCQWGAKGYADQGWAYRRILAHYYPGTDLQTLY